ncbi:Aldehyde/histidinol dehydrogenase [Pseudocohnilembus persalinus]|uniref:Aldehyde/histidinol dehydrogenase n=1 Tax=Pseudocohnilembus persalinus TaxID=266149 RepID=A0A0V0QXE7_PSEPJ|nr:Aldehyde/histidinol dehydrogenase [Pseudocohnilembus persalinus]|eukprot:KRX06886.1 Aldehyde/histidinol dehydrogenase [Pseudocohnilembus persalinus]
MSILEYKEPQQNDLPPCQLFINGEFVSSSKKAEIQLINPSNGQNICKIQEGDKQDIEIAIEHAKQSFGTWKNVNVQERCQYILNLADEVEKNKKQFIQIESFNTGRTIEQSSLEINQIIEILRFYGGQSNAMMGKTFVNSSNQMNYTQKLPFGVVGVITGWNSQFLNAVKIFVPALIAGNTIVHKCSEITPLSLLKLCQAMQQIGFPRGVYNMVTGYGPTAGKALSTSRKIQMLSYQGSLETGKIIEQDNNKSLKKLKISYNCKGIIIVGPDVDVEGCANLAWLCTTYSNGQNNMSAERILIHQQVYDKFLGILKKIAKQHMKIGSPFEGASFGPMVNKFQLEKIQKYVDLVQKQMGGKIEEGGKIIEGKSGYYFPPTLITDVQDIDEENQENLANQVIEGILAPVVQLLKPWKSIDEVIERANKNSLGNSCIIMEKNQGAVQKLIRNLQFSNVYINSWMLPNIQIPYSGSLHQAKYNSEQGGIELINEYCEQKAIYIHYEEKQM